jgi:L-lysine 2,3-aminomutase
MIELSNPATWQQAMKNAIRDSQSLCKALNLSPNDLSLSEKGEREFPVFVPLEFLSRMQLGNPSDPLLLQVLPQSSESIVDPEFSNDPVGDSAVELAPGLLHKYAGRVLLILSGACAIHCRYCFRRHYPYGTAPKNFERWHPALRYIEDDPSIHEVLFSGGDPLTLTDQLLGQLISRLDSIPHVTRLRIHTRLPVVIPQRIDDSLLSLLANSKLSKWVVLHINHVQEIDASVVCAIRRLQQIGITVLNQSVLLKGINDSVQAQYALCEKLIDTGVMPYYLHQLDRVSGASHFEASTDHGLQIVETLTSMLPGFGVPKYVQEIAGENSKTSVSVLEHLTPARS